MADVIAWFKAQPENVQQAVWRDLSALVPAAEVPEAAPRVEDLIEALKALPEDEKAVIIAEATKVYRPELGYRNSIFRGHELEIRERGADEWVVGVAESVGPHRIVVLHPQSPPPKPRKKKTVEDNVAASK